MPLCALPPFRCAGPFFARTSLPPQVVRKKKGSQEAKETAVSCYTYMPDPLDPQVATAQAFAAVLTAVLKQAVCAPATLCTVPLTRSPSPACSRSLLQSLQAGREQQADDMLAALLEADWQQAGGEAGRLRIVQVEVRSLGGVPSSSSTKNTFSC